MSAIGSLLVSPRTVPARGEGTGIAKQPTIDQAVAGAALSALRLGQDSGAPGSGIPRTPAGALGSRERASEVPPVPHLIGTTVRVGGWSRTSRVVFQWRVPQSPVATTFLYAVVPVAGHATPLWQRTAGDWVALPAIADGRWRLLVRAMSALGPVSRAAVWPFALARHAPAPRLVAAQPAPRAWSAVATPSLRWAPGAGSVPVREYEYRVIPAGRPQRTLPDWTTTQTASLALPSLADGAWSVQVRAVDQLGNRSPARTWSFHLDREPPALTAPTLSATSFTPPIEGLSARFGLSKQALVTYAIYAAGQPWPVRSGSLGWLAPGTSYAVRWDGRLHGQQIAPPGSYVLVVRAVDRAGNRALVKSVPVTLQDKWIRISLRKEEIWAYQGNRLIASSPVTTGGPLAPTPTGIFHVLAKYTGWVFHSPWPAGSPLWYPDSPTNFALLYQATDGYFIHDAPWRSNYGPGSNSVTGSPGGNYTGTHGCTNVPYNVMATLFTWADVGTTIQIVS